MLPEFFVGNRKPEDSYWNLRLWLIRGLGFLYLIVFAIIFFQGDALWGRNGLLPIDSVDPSGASNFFDLPTLFRFLPFDSSKQFLVAFGFASSCVLMLGYANFFLLAGLWLVQLSFVNSGQVFYSFGWETLLLEFTFLCGFLVPIFEFNLKKTSVPPPRIAIWALRWLVFRLMLGAGLIKLRGDPCWRDLTCLNFHYETQPNPNPLSFFLHHMPSWAHTFGVLFNHFVEIVVPFSLLGPKKIRRWGGILCIVFQITLILSGNLAWFNWLTLILCLACFDDEFLEAVFVRFKTSTFPPPSSFSVSNAQFVILLAFAALVIDLSIDPARNLFRRQQVMNTSYNNWNLINSYGAFGSVNKFRGEVIIEGTTDEAITPDTRWFAYEFFCAPGDVSRAPCWISPYHYHLDWQIWFSGMKPNIRELWLLRLAVRLLENDREVLNILKFNPFQDHAPRYVRMRRYQYRFAEFSEWPKNWWQRTLLSEYMEPMGLGSPLAQSLRK